MDLEGVDDVVRHALIDALAYQPFSTLKIRSSTLPPDVVSDLEAHGFAKPTNNQRYADRLILRPLIDDSSDDRWSIDGVELRHLENWDLRAATATTY